MKIFPEAKREGVMKTKIASRFCPALLLVLLLATPQGFADGSDVPQDAPTACMELQKVNCFAFGGVGIGGTISRGESCFHVIAESKDGLFWFHAALTRGTPEAKMYALCGIRKLSPAAFEMFAKPVAALTNSVNLMSGCIGSSADAASVVNRIKSGAYDLHFNSIVPLK